MFRLSGDDGSLLSLLSGWDGSSNPFGSGFLRLEQGDDRHPAPVGPGRRRPRMGLGDARRLREHRRSAPSPRPISAGYHPAGWAVPAGETITGTDEDEILIGTVGDDSIDALGGKRLRRSAGPAPISSPAATEPTSCTAMAATTSSHGGNQDDTLSGRRRPRLAVRRGRQRHPLRRAGRRPALGRGRRRRPRRRRRRRPLDGGVGQDTLAGGLGADMLTGGLDADILRLPSASSGLDEITDFVSGSDKILVSADGFGGGLVAGGAVSLVSGTDPTASELSGPVPLRHRRRAPVLGCRRDGKRRRGARGDVQQPPAARRPRTSSSSRVAAHRSAPQTARSTSSFLVSAIALAGLRPLGQTLAQFMIVWQR